MNTPAGHPAELEAVVRASGPRLVAALAAAGGDIAGAEDALGDAIADAVRQWPESGVPTNPEGWLFVVARRRMIAAHRRRQTAQRAEPDLALIEAERAESEAETLIPDRRLALMFACTHPAIDRRIRAPLMLQVILGLDAARIASAFVVSPATLGQRLVRAKAKIRDTAIPFAIPEEGLEDRVGAVLDAIYAGYTAGWDDPLGHDAKRRGLSDEAIRLARLTLELLPDEPEVMGLLALMLHSRARSDARRSDGGSFVPLAEQDTSRWSGELMAEAERLLASAATARRPGQYQLLAAIQSVHNLRVVTGVTDWQSIGQLYDGLVTIAPSLGAMVARAAAHAEVHGPEVGLELLDGLELGRVQDYQPYWAVRAELEFRTGGAQAARRSLAIAVGLTDDPAVRAHLIGRGRGGEALSFAVRPAPG